MYHQLSKLSGRLVSATHLQSPLFPVVPIALQRVEPPQIQYTTAQLSTVTEGSACAAPSSKRNIPGTNIPYAQVPEAIRKQQALLQKDDDVPVFLKGGPLDGILYRLSMALCVVGLIGIGHTIYIHAVPRK